MNRRKYMAKGEEKENKSSGSSLKDRMPEQEGQSLETRFAESDFIPKIPTKDPEAALQFCQALARFLKTHPRVLAGIESPATGNDQERTPAGLSIPEISVVIPIYNEEENLPHLYARLTAALKGTGRSYEIIFVDDGSRDESLDCLHRLVQKDRAIKVIELSRNFGHQIAISAGLDYARGKGVIVMDADLQDPPEVLPQFINKWQEGHDVVYAIRKDRKESWIKRLAYATFYRLLHRIARVEIPVDAGDFCIMDRRVVDLLMAMPERNRFIRGIRSWVGLDQVGLPYERQARHAGRSGYTLKRLVYLALDGLISFSFWPLRVIAIAGILISLFSIGMAVFYAAKKLIVGLNPPGFATLTVALFFFAGIQLITIGIIGEYVGRIFEEVKQRPLYVVRRVWQGGRNARVDGQQ